MAIYQMCTVLDMVAQQYGRPFFAVSEGSAIRGFQDEVNRPGDSVLFQHPDDFQLFIMGQFDDETAAIDLLDTPRLLVSGAQMKDRAQAGLVADLSADQAAALQAVRPKGRAA